MRIVLISILLAMLTGCMTTYRERTDAEAKDGELEPNKPSAEELREICPI